MDDKLPAGFEEDAYIEWLLELRQSDHVGYGTYPQAVKDIVEEYEREKEAAQNIGKGID